MLPVAHPDCNSFSVLVPLVFVRTSWAYRALFMLRFTRISRALHVAAAGSATASLLHKSQSRSSVAISAKIFHSIVTQQATEKSYYAWSSGASGTREYIARVYSR